MTWQERRTITVLCTILAILFAALLIVLSMRYYENRELPEESAAVETGSQIVEEQVFCRELTYFNGSTTLSFSLNEETQKWRWTHDTAFPLDESTVLSILEQLIAWDPVKTISASAVTEDVGLAQSSGRLTVFMSDGTNASLIFGNLAGDGSGRYARLNGDTTKVHVVSDDLYKKMCVPIYDMMALPAMPALPESAISTILIRGQESANPDDPENPIPAPVTLLTAYHADDNPANTFWRSNGADVSGSKTLRSLLLDLDILKLKKCVIYRPSDEAVTLCGFDDPVATMKIKYATAAGTEETLLLTVGNLLPGSADRYVQMGEDDSTIYQLPSWLTDSLLQIAAKGLESA